MLDREFLKGGFILVVSFGIYNILNFVFHFSMARLLDVAEYGILATLLSIVYLLGIFSESIQTIVSKQASNSKKNVSAILRNAMGRVSRPSLALFGFYLILSIPLSIFLKIPYLLMGLNGMIIFASFYSPINRGLLQGKKRFFALGSNMIIESVAKLVFSLILVFIGLDVYGPVLGGLLGAGGAYALSFINLQPLIGEGKQSVNEDVVYEKGKESFLTIFALMAFFSLDVVIARLVFDPDAVGAYAISSTIAKTIFFAAMPIAKAMFSFTAEKVRVKRAEKVFLNALAIVGAGIVLALTLFYFFPHIWVGIFSGKDLPLATGTLFVLGMAYSLITLTQVILLYKISIHAVRSIWPILLMPVVEAVLLYIFSANLFQFSFALVASSALFLWISIMTNPR